MAHAERFLVSIWLDRAGHTTTWYVEAYSADSERVGAYVRPTAPFDDPHDALRHALARLDIEYGEQMILPFWALGLLVPGKLVAMAPLPEINDVFRIDIPWATINGVSPVNVFHVQTTLTDVQEIATTIADAFPDDGSAFAPQHINQSASTLGVTPLDGVTPRIEVAVSSDGLHGTESGEIIPAAACILSLRTNRRGSRGRGRLFIGPVCEGAWTNGFIVESQRENVLEGWIAADAALLANSPSITLGVASYKYSTFAQLQSFVVPPPGATQRRRQNQLK